MSITFSSDNGKISEEDIREASRLCETYFNTQKDPSQIQTSLENDKWIYGHIKNYVNLIRNDEELIGYTLMIPCTISLMNDFLKKTINEAELFESIKQLNPPSPTAIYLCDSFVKENYRKKGLATTVLIKTLTPFLTTKPVLFYYKYSEEGERLVKKVAQELNLELKARR